ncbi:hypothetical protein [Synechococcus sp. MU1617]|uniref:hypothetical protein n=1 Tax=Synechococcus sp. MU1617 TaxID=2508346 RepID=UPI001CF92E2F|nr:hypothetical protein [Synechococcus sp. MU1617]MCB4389389.1 hypothetical protein [Synechococcus sp. MU1617]
MSSIDKENEYERFAAIRGMQEEASERSLAVGELGLWKSWLKILEEESKKTEKEYHYLHIIEDDARLGKSLFQVISNMNNKGTGHDIIFTDMYVNPSVYKAYAGEYKSNLKKGTVKLLENVYTGCTSSCIIHNSKINKIHQLLLKSFSSDGPLKPLDNTLRNLMVSRDIIIGVTAPLLTTIETKYIRESTIQSDDDYSISLTQEYCAILRRELSCMRNERTEEELLKIIRELISAKIAHAKAIEKTDKCKHDQGEILTILRATELLSLLKYKYRKNLQGDKDNDQKMK